MRALHVFSKPASKVEDPPCAKGKVRLDAFPNRPTTATISRTSSTTREGCKILTIRIRSVRVDKPPKLGEKEDDPLERISTRPP
ncbi:hypothetical protein TNCV_3100121 [Trichonephila clavipes]|nr:hypothetical protein TNCV_3100121 [Trichonephila clavipes]